MTNLNSIPELQKEFDGVRIDMNEYHEKMQFMHEVYESNVFYKQKPNARKLENIGVNLVQAFTDKNWFYLSQFPKVSVPAMPDNREASSKTEKIVYTAYDHNDMQNLWSQYTFDTSVMSAAVQVTDLDYKAKKVRYMRIDPRRAYWTTSDAQGTEPEVFWSAVPMRQSAIKRKYGVDVSGSNAEGLDYWKAYDDITIDNLFDDPFYMVVTRIDSETMVRWCGDKWLMKPHNHSLGCMPVDISLPLRLATSSYKGDFFIRRLVDLQLEFNEAWRQRANIVRRLGNPAVWGRNINNNQMNDVKQGLSLDGGFIGLKEGGELGILTIPETKMIDEKLNDIYSKMQDVSGFPPAAFGTVAGANTSADALGMYYQPTTRQIDHQNKAFTRFLENVNRKTLSLYKLLLKTNDSLPLSGSPSSLKKFANEGMLYSQQVAYDDQFTIDDIVTLRTVVTPATVTPKDDIAYKRLMYEMARDGVLSKTTAFDEIGFISPQDELDLLEAETSNPNLNPEGASKLMSSQAQLDSAQASMMGGAGAPAGPEMGMPPDPAMAGMPELGAADGYNDQAY